MELSEHIFNDFWFYKIKGDDAPTEILDSILDALNRINIESKNVIDGGSNIGLYSLEFAKRVGAKGIVYSFELQPIIFEISVKNFELNKVKNIISRNNALSNVSGKWVGYSEIDYYAEYLSSGGIRTEPSLVDKCRVETVAIDDLYLKNIGLIKLDIEGHEPIALDGMWQTIDKYKPYLIIELSDGYLGNAVQETIDKIKSHGYFVSDAGSHNYLFEPNLSL